MAEALAKGKLTSEDLAAIASRISVNNRRLEKRRATVMNAIVWQDTRVSPDVAHSARRVARTGSRKTGLPLSTYFSGLKLRWILKNVRGVAERAQAANFSSEYRYVSSVEFDWRPRGGVHATDVTNASRTQSSI